MKSQCCIKHFLHIKKRACGHGVIHFFILSKKISKLIKTRIVFINFSQQRYVNLLVKYK